MVDFGVGVGHGCGVSPGGGKSFPATSRISSRSGTSDEPYSVFRDRTSGCRMTARVMASSSMPSAMTASSGRSSGGTSVVTVSPGLDGFEFVVVDNAGKPALKFRDAQHEYEFEGTAAATASAGTH